MKITELFSNNLFLAPMAGFSDAGFRALAKKYGAALTVTEMISAKALDMNSRITRALLYCDEAERPRAVQLFGHEPEVFRRVAQSPELSGFDIIDINMGCPVKKIVGNGDGSALLENLPLAAKLIEAVKQSGKFVTVKCRIGVEGSGGAEDFARMCQSSGADMIVVHGRTRNQFYGGKADWGAIARVAGAVGIPVVANGDITDKASFEACMSRTGAWGAAVGRGALGRPYLFAEILGHDYSFDILESVAYHTKIFGRCVPERVLVNEMKKHICLYVKGISGCKAFAVKLFRAKSMEEMTDMLRGFLNGTKN